VLPSQAQGGGPVEAVPRKSLGPMQGVSPDAPAANAISTSPMQNGQKAPRKRRRHWKGERVGTFVPLPVELRRLVDDVAKQEGLPLGDVLTRLVAEGLGTTAPAFCYPSTTDHATQEELPLKAS
jgi:hypothetical protein